MLSALGHLHPVLVHLPIGVLFAAAAAELLVGKGDEPRAVLVRRALYVLAAAGALGTAATGWWLAREGYSGEVLFRHRWSAVALTVATAAAAMLDLAGAPARGRRMLLGVALALVCFTGHQGGTLTHGRGFLFGSRPEVPEVAPAGDADEADALERAVHELLARKCVECHGPDKQKSGLRLDVPGDLLAVVEPGLPGDSELFRRIVLAPSHEDVMPPEGDGVPIADEELLAVLRWIRAGAPLTQLEGR